MGIEALRRLWPPATRWTHRTAGRDGRPAVRWGRTAGYDETQAQALCDLVADPASGITRVTVVCAGAGLLAAIEDVAAARALLVQGDAALERDRRPRRESEGG